MRYTINKLKKLIFLTPLALPIAIQASEPPSINKEDIKKQLINIKKKIAETDRLMYGPMYAIAGNGYYSDFSFNTNNGPLFSNYDGHTGFANIGGLAIRPRYGTYINVMVNASESEVNGRSVLTGSLNRYHLSSHGEGFYANFLQRLPIRKIPVFISLYGGAHYSRFKNTTQITVPVVPTGTIFPEGFATYRGNSSLIGTGLSTTMHEDKWDIYGSINYWYSRNHTDAYTMVFNSAPAANSFSAPLNVTMGNFSESLAVYYKHFDVITPFVNAGLIQSFNRKLSRPVSINTLPPGITFPELTFLHNGYTAGGGVVIKKSDFTFSPAYQYVKRGRFHSNSFNFTAKLLLS